MPADLLQIYFLLSSASSLDVSAPLSNFPASEQREMQRRLSSCKAGWKTSMPTCNLAKG